MSKMRKFLIAILTLISAVCLTLVGCSKSKVTFVDFEDKTIEYDLYELFDATEYLDVYDTNGNLYYANIKIYDADGQKVPHLYYQFRVEKTYYKLVIEIKDDQEVIGTRELIINGVNKTPPYIMILNMPEFGVKDTDVFIPLEIDAKGATVVRKLVVEQYVTEKVNGEYVTELDSENAIVVNDSQFTDNGVSFRPTEPGVYRFYVYAWNSDKTEAEARVISKEISIKETADAWGEIEGFDAPESLVANYHQYAVDYEYNPYRGLGRLIYVTNTDGDYLDANGNILYKKVDESATEHRIAFYKKANEDATEYDVLAYYQDLTTYHFYDAEDNIAYTKEGCVTVKDADGVADYYFHSKNATIGEEWYQKFTDKAGVTKFGVIKAQASENRYSDKQRLFHIQSTYRDNTFYRDWFESEDLDYLSIWVLILPKNADETQTTVNAFKNVDFNVSAIPVGKWYEFKVSKVELRTQTNPYNIFASGRTATSGSYFTVTNEDYAKFDFYFDSFSYAKGATITMDSEVSLMGQEITLDIENAGELTKNDFEFYVGKTDGYDNDLNAVTYGILSASSYSIANFFKNYPLLEGYSFTPAIEGDLTSRKYFIQARLNEQGLAKNNGEQIYASKIISSYNVAVNLGTAELGQDVTIDANIPGIKNATYKYFYKEASATDYIELVNTNVFKPTKPTMYDVKVVVTVGNAQIEKNISKDYTKEIELNVAPADGANKYVINSDISVAAVLEGAKNLTINAFDENNNPVTISKGKINVAATGTYTITATCDYNGVELTKSVVIDVVGDKNVTAQFLANSQAIDLNNAVLMNSVITIVPNVEGVDAPISANYSYKVVKLDSNPTNNYEIDVVDGTFTAGHVGTYQITVYYIEGQARNASDVYTLTVTANPYEEARFVETFSDSASVTAAYKVELDTSNPAKISQIAYKGDYENYAANTSYYNEFEGRYGVIKTQPQVNYKNGNWGEARLGIYLRSSEYKTDKDFQEAGVTRTVYGTEARPASYVAKYMAYNSDNWDYISVMVYFPKANAGAGETIQVGNVHLTNVENVPYNTWYELKLDKPRMVGSFTDNYGYIFDQFTSASDATALFYIAHDDASATANMNQPVYIDSISFEQYEGYERFDELYFYDNTNGKVIAPDSFETIFTVNNALEGPIDFILNAKAGGKVLDVSNLEVRYLTWANGVTTDFYKADGSKISKKSGYEPDKNKGLYRVQLTKVDTSKHGYNMFCFTYYDADTEKNYIGYRFLYFNYAEKGTETE